LTLIYHQGNNILCYSLDRTQRLCGALIMQEHTDICVARVESGSAGCAKIFDRSGNMFVLRVDDTLAASKLVEIFSIASMEPSVAENHTEAPTEDLVAEHQEKIPTEVVTASALTANGETIDLGELKVAQSIHDVKTILAMHSGMSVGSQQLFLLHDNRDDVDDLELRDDARVKEVIVHTLSTTELQFAVMHRGGHACTFVSLPPRYTGCPHGFDTNGALFFIATAGGTQEYANPHDSGQVVAVMSTCLTGCNSTPSRFVMHSNPGRGAFNVTKNQPMQWMSVDLGEGRALVPNHYCLRYGNNAGHHQPCPRNWVLEGSNDGATWIILRRHHMDETLPAEELSVASWPVEMVNEAYRHFRIFQTGLNSSSDHYFACAGIELYGELLGDPEGLSCRLSPAAGDAAAVDLDQCEEAHAIWS
jgi:hypothetical protein